jgi:hypothetical protein
MGIQINGVNDIISATDGSLSLPGADLTNLSQVNVTGVGTFANLVVTGNVSIAGTLTYEDVTNVDSIGIVTARSGVRIDAGGIVVVGVTTVAAGTAALPSISPTGDSNTGIFFPSADTIAFGEGGAEAARFDSSGRFGIGTSPSYKLHVSGNNAVSADNTIAMSYGRAANPTDALHKITWGSDDLRIEADTANTIASNITFTNDGTERARIDASGRLLIGTSTSLGAGDGQHSLLQIRGNESNLSTGAFISLSRGAASTATGQTLGQIIFTDNGGGIYSTILCESDGTPGVNDFPGRIVLATTADGASSPTERMRITQSGRFGFGNIDPSYFADLKTASNARFVVHNSGTGLAMLGFADSGSNYQDGRIDAYSLNIVTGSGSLFGGSTGVRLANGATSWSSLSDERQKTSLTPIEDGLSKVAGLRAVTGRYLTDDPDKSRSFLIAQDVQAVLPEAVLVEDPYRQ